jgi:predicted RNA binding protein YcfA (HicA-like mRNA interferase family)
MNGKIKVIFAGLDKESIDLTIETYTSLRELVSSNDFLKITKLHPNKLTFYVNGERAPSDQEILLVPGDEITYDSSHIFYAIHPRNLIKNLKDLVDLKFERHGGNHDIWVTGDGKRVPISRTPRDISNPGIIKKILKEAGLSMSLEEFSRYKCK